MPVPALATSSVFVMPAVRSLPVIASLVLHAGIGVGVAASVGGHARVGASSPVTTLEIDVDAPEAPALAPAVTPAPPVEAPPPETHRHSYPVAAPHDAHPHDPALHHHAAKATPRATAGPVAAPAAASPAADGASLPRFSIASGSDAPMGARAAAKTSPSGSPAGDVDGDGDTAVHGASAVDVAARLTRSVTAAYPTHARADEIEGDVGVEIVVGRDGRVVQARVVRPAGHGLDQAALVAVRGYRFSPAQRAGHTVRVRMPWSVQFRLR